MAMPDYMIDKLLLKIILTSNRFYKARRVEILVNN